VIPKNYLAHHRAHDYPHLIERWRAVAARAGLVMRPIAKCGKLPVYSVRTRKLPPEGTIYLSAGIHGDEPASTEGLITWAEKNIRLLKRRPFFIIPCINPWGLVNNYRMDSQGRDLNRNFQNDAIPQLAALKRAAAGRKYALAMMLHEDYDAQGLYIYEFVNATPYWGEAMLKAASLFIPADKRKIIEHRKACNGLVRRKLDMKLFKKIGLPEALYFHLQGCPRVFTVETPSEYSLDRRVRAHAAIIAECVRRACTPPGIAGAPTGI
jgi:hypothetical protein